MDKDYKPLMINEVIVHHFLEKQFNCVHVRTNARTPCLVCERVTNSSLSCELPG
jgi:hypothetical protein